MSSQSHSASTARYIEAPLKYLANDENVAYVASTGGGDESEHGGNYVMETLPIYDARTRSEGFSLDKEGFILAGHQTEVKDFYSDDQINDIYETEVKALVKSATGASRVEIFDHTRRSSSVEVQKIRNIRESASIIHNDYTARSGPNRLRDHFPDSPDEVEALLKRRFAIINVWRSIKGTILNAPLAFCDASTIADKDLVSVTRQAKDRIGEIQLAIYNPTHRWYYFSNMQADEALLFKTYDSKDDGRARFTIHTSFDDPSAPEDAPSRESIETRCFVFF